MDFESAMQTFAEAWMAANRGGRILIPTENQPKIQDSNGSGNGGKNEEEENSSKNGDDERVSLNFSSNYRFTIYKMRIFSYLKNLHSFFEFMSVFCRQITISFTLVAREFKMNLIFR